MEKVLYQLRYFLVISLIFLFAGVIFCSFISKIDLHLIINQYHSSFFDEFFKNITIIGDGAFAIILLPYLLLFVAFRDFLISLFTCFFAGMLAQFFKKVVFADALRPSMLIPKENMYLIDGVPMHGMYSFPSGHTASAFALFILLAFFSRHNKNTQISCAVGAVMVAFSRVYLSQHFLGDIIFGAFLGILAFIASFLLMQQLQFNKLQEPLADLIFAKQKRLLSFRERLGWRPLK